MLLRLSNANCYFFFRATERAAWAPLVLEARDGDEALVVARQHHGEIGLLIADVLMPGLTGPRLAERLIQERPLMRVLCTSGYTEGLMKHAGLENRPVLLPKPFLAADLLRSVDEVFRPA